MGIEIGPLHVRRSAFINASPARVWKEFETAESIRGWLDSGHQVHEFEPQVGGKVDLINAGRTPVIEKDIGEIIATAVAATRSTAWVRVLPIDGRMIMTADKMPTKVSGIPSAVIS